MLSRFTSFFIFLFTLIYSGVFAQSLNPGPKKIFKEDEIAIIDISMDPADKAWMLHDDNKWSDIYLPANFSFKNSDIDTTLAFQVGIRLRGNTSRNHEKKSFKLKFKEYGGEKFYDQKKFNLKAEVNDPALVREMLALRAFRDFEIPAARSHHTEVYINSEYMGLYLNVEQIDDEFVQGRFDYDAGNIYKCYWGANLSDAGAVYNNDIYELETNKELNDRSVLSNFVNVLNNTSSTEFITEIEKVFNVDRYIRYLAVEALTGHWDGYSYNQNNFYLYENDTTGLVEFIAYDVDNTFGIDWVSRDWGTRDVLDWVRHGGDPRPLSHKILAQEAYFERYKRYLDTLLKTTFSTTYYYAEFDFYEIMLADPIGRDLYYPLPFGFTITEFHDSFDQQVAGHAPYGLKPYVSTRTSTARDQVGVVLALDDFVDTTFEIFPNPTMDGKFYLKSTKLLQNIKIRDIVGKEYNYQLMKNGSENIEISVNLPSGVYFLSADGKTERFLVK